MRFKQGLLIVFTAFAAFFTTIALAQGIQNTNPLCFIYMGTKSSGASCSANNKPAACYSLSPGGQEWISITSTTGWITLDFNVASFDPKTQTCGSDYIGGFTVTFSNDGKPPKVTSYNNEETKVYAVDSNTGLYGIYFFPDSIPTSPTPSTYNGVIYRGINLSGAEFNQPYSDPPSAYDALYFVKQGMNIVRIPFRWEYLQAPNNLGKPIDFSSGYGKKIMDVTTALVAAKIYVILDMHNYMRYPLNTNNIDGPRIGVNSIATPMHYANAWSQIAAELVRLNLNSPYVMLDLMNEPWSESNSSLPTQTILNNYNQAISEIRKAGFSGLLLLEGNAFTGLLDWSKSYYGKSNSTTFIPSNINDPLNNYAINVHQYLGADDSPTTGECLPANTILVKKNFQTFLNWIYQYKVPVILTETGGINTSNCASTINALLTGIEANPYIVGKGGFIGWLGWTGGHAWYLTPDSIADKKLFIAPDIYGKERVQMLQGFEINGHLVAPK